MNFMPALGFWDRRLPFAIPTPVTRGQARLRL
jgi:hypothetical protein